VSRNGTNCVRVKILMNVIFVFKHLAMEHKVPETFRLLR
jgi:hypothetical protein